jgi:hypothetical protein
MLFFGNIVKNADNYRELQDCALRIIPSISTSEEVRMNTDYNKSKNFGYYNSFNIYNKVGYFNNEYYRFGVVYIYENGTLSNVYNTVGFDLKDSVTLTTEGKELFENEEQKEVRKYIKIDDNGWVINNGEYDSSAILNARGVCKMVTESSGIIGIKFNIPKEIVDHLTNLGIRGLFFVRQKRVPNLLG